MKLKKDVVGYIIQGDKIETAIAIDEIGNKEIWMKGKAKDILSQLNLRQNKKQEEDEKNSSSTN